MGLPMQVTATDGGGGGGSFNPAGLPQVDDGAAVRTHAATLKTSLAGVATTADGIKATWGGLGGTYTAPEAGELVSAMNTPATCAHDMVTRHEQADSALNAYATKLEELARRRESIATAMSRQNDAWSAFQARKAAATVDYIVDPMSGYTSQVWSDPGIESTANALYDSDKQIMGDAAQFASDLMAADIECANAINRIFGGTQWHLNGKGAGENGYGATADAFLAAARKGESPWGNPQSWTDGTMLSVQRRTGDQFLDDGKQTLALFGHALSFWDDEEGAAAREALVEGGKQGFHDIGMMASLPMAVIDWHEYSAAWGRQVGPLVSYGNWTHDPNGAAGDIMFTGVLALTTKGAGKVAGAGMGALSRSVTVNGMREAAFVNAARGLDALATKAKNFEVPTPPMRGPWALEPQLVGPVGAFGAMGGRVNPFTKPAGELSRLSDYIMLKTREVKANGKPLYQVDPKRFTPGMEDPPLLIDRNGRPVPIRSNLDTLKRNMAKQGEVDPRFVKPEDKNYEAHHIVPVREAGAGPALEVLRKWGIDIDSWENGVYLPTRKAANLKGSTLHRATQRPRAESYSHWVSRQLERADSRDEALRILDRIRDSLLAGKDPW